MVGCVITSTNGWLCTTAQQWLLVYYSTMVVYYSTVQQWLVVYYSNNGGLCTNVKPCTTVQQWLLVYFSTTMVACVL